jgi:DNA modification methylase
VTPYYADPWLTVYAGDCRAVMAELAGASVHTVVTSPPYWGLRDYGTATWTGGDEACVHSVGGQVNQTKDRGTLRETAIAAGQRPGVDASRCRLCGAVRVDGQIGLEPTPEAYVETMVAVFREVRRVLRDDGTVWLNLGDSYAGSGKGAFGTDEARDAYRPKVKETYVPTRAEAPTAGVVPVGLKPKDLVGIPWRVAFALQADGWYLRSDVVWSKPNPMPESVTDRPTKSHEYVFLLSKRERYFFDAEAVRESVVSGPSDLRKMVEQKPRIGGKNLVADDPLLAASSLTKLGRQRSVGDPSGRNLRSVWTIATQPYPGAHFATFPEALVEPCVKAGTSERGVCPDCGASWVRVVERERAETAPEPAGYLAGLHATTPAQTNGFGSRSAVRYPNSMQLSERGGVPSQTTGWRPSCRHDAEPVPATVLDLFAGSGTTGRVAQRLGRRAVLIDLNPAYLLQALKRNGHGPDEVGTEPMFDTSSLWGGEAA